MSTLMIANPRKKRRKMSALQRQYFGGGGGTPRKARRRRTRTIVKTIVRRSSAPSAVSRRGRRRSSSGGGGIGGLLSLRGGSGLVGNAKTVAIQGGAAAAGLITTQMVLDRIPWVKDLTGNKRIGAKIVLAAAVATFGKRVIPGNLAGAVATGIAAGAMVDVWTNWQASRAPAAPAELSGGIASPGGIGYRGLNRRYVANN